SEAMSGKMREEAAMSVPSAAAETGVRGDSAPTDDTRLRGRPLALARGAWLILALLTLATVVATIPIEYTRLQQICLSPDCEHPHLTPDSLRELQALGLSSSFFTAYFIIAEVVFALVWIATGLVIFWHKSDGRMALLTALVLVLGSTFALNPRNLAAAYPIWWLPAALVSFLGSASLTNFLFIFPDGHFVPRWTKWLATLWVVQQLPVYFFPDSPLNSDIWPQDMALGLYMLTFGTVLTTQFYRYRRVSSPQQRQQTRWLLFSFAVAFATLLGLATLKGFLPSPGIVAELLGNTPIHVTSLR